MLAAARRIFLLPVLMLAALACGGGVPAGTVGPTQPGGPTQPPAEPTQSPAGPTQPPAGPGLPVGSPISGIDQITTILTPADFTAVGVSGAGPGSDNPSGNAHYIVYAGLSAGAGGIELDIFVFDTPADATTDFGGTAFYTLDQATIQRIGADDAGYYPDQPGNSAGTSFDEIRVLKGKVWFDLAIPSSAQAEQQLISLAALIVARGGVLF
jgi:hypothetical protein